jgi:hypothetical protein
LANSSFEVAPEFVQEQQCPSTVLDRLLRSSSNGRGSRLALVRSMTDKGGA